MKKNYGVNQKRLKKLKVEVQDLKQMIDLEENKDGKWSKVSTTINCTKCDSKCKNESSLKKHMNLKHTGNFYICEQCEFQAMTEEKFKEHIDDEHGGSQKSNYKTKSRVQLNSHINHTEPEHNCKDNDFQATTQLQLNKHKNLKHIPKGQKLEEVIQCRYCEQQFSEIWNLMNHRKKEHKSTVALCRNKLANKCRFDSEKCWWNHEKTSNSFECFICNQTFVTKNEMMLHRKTNHAEMVKHCTKDRCNFQEKFCWFIHEKTDKEIDSMENSNDIEEDEEVKSNSVFRDVRENLKPPIKKKE